MKKDHTVRNIRVALGAFTLAALVFCIYGAAVYGQSPEIQCAVNAQDLFLLECQEGEKQFTVTVKREFRFHPDLIAVLYKDRRGRLRLSHIEEQERSQFGTNWDEHKRDGRLIRR